MKIDINKALDILSTKTTIPSLTVFEFLRLVGTDDYAAIMTGSNRVIFEHVKDCISIDDLNKLKRDFKSNFILDHVEYEKIRSNERIKQNDTKMSYNDTIRLLRELIGLDRAEIYKKKIEYLLDKKVISRNDIILYVTGLDLSEWSDTGRGQLYTYFKKRFNVSLGMDILSSNQRYRLGKDIINYSRFSKKNCKMVIDQLDKYDEKGLSLVDRVIQHITSWAYWNRDIIPYLTRLKRKLETREVPHLTTILLRLSSIFDIPEYIDGIMTKYHGIKGGIKFELNENRDKIIVTEVKEN